jgi:hypothetical protein
MGHYLREKTDGAFHISTIAADNISSHRYLVVNLYSGPGFGRPHDADENQHDDRGTDN